MEAPRHRERVIARSLRIIRAHPNVVAATAEILDARSGSWAAGIEVRIGLPNAWAADGQSPGGVRVVEPVRLVFPGLFPVRPPIIYLRRDFDRTLAHVQPGDAADPPEPCIVDGSLAELLHEQGLPGILNQLVYWLENAALGRLIDPKQGWEPVRRDDLPGFIVADAADLRGRVSRKEGSVVFGFEYLLFADEERGASYVYGEAGTRVLTPNPETIRALIRERALPKSVDVRVGSSLTIVAWPGRQPSGTLVVADRYEPETVTDLGGLMTRATAYGCAGALRDKLNWLNTCLADYRNSESFPLAVILCARRPYPVIGSDSPIELCPYVIDVGPPAFLAVGDRTPVFPVGHRHAITVPLLRRLSGDKDADEPQNWVQVGCGSLGSKIALHLARTGRAPGTVIDRSYLSPHNAARHALAPDAGAMHLHWIEGKARALADAIEGLGQRPVSVAQDVITISRSADLAKKWLPKNSWAIVNATASLVVRDALGSIPSEIEIPRVVEASLFAGGQIGLLSVEGPCRNPDTLDLITEAYALARADGRIGATMFGSGRSVARQTIGEGCGSATMVMTDARVSMFAAPMAEAIHRMQATSLPDTAGKLLISALGDDGLGLSWMDHAVPPVLIVGSEGPDGWTVRLSDRVCRKIAEEVGRWPNAETGGILMGRFSEAARAFYVADVLPAPEDSVRATHEFVLGTRGARKAIRDYAESCHYSLFCLGTWHSHLAASGPSGLDRTTAGAIALARIAPSVLLIHTPAGYRALLADASDTAPQTSEDD